MSELKANNYSLVDGQSQAIKHEDRIENVGKR
jgi:hypothetical protein